MITEYENMLGKTMISVEETDYNEMVFISTDNHKFTFFHSQSCCEDVRIESIDGDLPDLVGSPILMAEQISSEDPEVEIDADSHTWTFYKFATNKGSVTVRWLGTSNDYYSESVDYIEEVVKL